MERKKAFLFPAFITGFTEKEIDFLQENDIDINQYLNRISKVLPVNFPEFSYTNAIFLQELNSQLLAYAMSCAMHDALKNKQISPDLIAGYSMGIYASLYASGAIEFEKGSELIYKAYGLVSEIANSGLYGMGAIIGLSVEDISKIIEGNAYQTEIINVNNEHSLVIAGKKNHLKQVLYKAQEEGALTTAKLTVDTPYHSKYLLKYAKAFEEFLEQVSVLNAAIPIISTYNQRVITGANDIKLELVYNLTQKINWHKTMLKLIALNVTEMYECGAGKDLKKISRFIQGNYTLKSVHKL